MPNDSMLRYPIVAVEVTYENGQKEKFNSPGIFTSRFIEVKPTAKNYGESYVYRTVEVRQQITPLHDIKGRKVVA